MKAVLGMRSGIKRLGYFAACLWLMVAICSTTYVATGAASAFSGVGDGTFENPYRISSCQELAEIEDDLSGTYKLTADLDCTADGNDIVVNGVFIGSLDGQSYSITYNLTDADFLAGLFHNLNGATVKNLTLNGAITTNPGASIVGGLAANIYNYSTVTNVTINSSISGPANTAMGGVGGVVNSLNTDGVVFAGSVNNSAGGNTGGLYGSMYCSSTIQDSHNSGTVTGNGGITGGIVGEDACEGPAGNYINVYNTGSITNDGDYVGGILGRGFSVSLSQVYNTGYVEGINNVGGIVGEANYSTSVYQSYSSGLVLGYGTRIGGVVGNLGNSSTVNQSYANSTVTTNDSYAGGLVGFLDGGSIDNSYARGEVHGEVVGGLVGYAWSGSISHAYSTGMVDTENENRGGLVALKAIEGDNGLFWDTDTSISTSVFGHGKTTAEMKDIATYTSTASEGLGLSMWDFVGNVNDDTSTDEVWSIYTNVNDGYPCLSWQSECTGEPSSPDSDGDGSSDAQEDAGPNNGDANNDSTADSLQDNVVAMLNESTNKYGVLELSPSCEIQVAGFGAASAIPTPDSGFAYPHGMYDFTADCGGSGQTFTVKFYYFDVDPASFVIRKYNPTTHRYSTVDTAQFSSTTIDGRNVLIAQYDIKDGGPLDMDGIEDGIITDPAGIAVANATSEQLASSGQSIGLLMVAASALLCAASLGALARRKHIVKATN